MSFPTPMTQEQIQNAIAEMREHIEERYEESYHLHAMLPKMEEMSQVNDYQTREKLMRWLGFMQGVLWSHGEFTVDDFRAMNTKEL